MNLKDIAEEIIKDAQKPLSPEEIWDIAESQGFKEKLKLTGKTIPKTIGAQLYIDIKENPDSRFVKMKTKPTRFYLKEHPFNITLLDNQPKTTALKKTSYDERDLHKLLTYYVYTYYSIYTKTIFHETSKKKTFAQWQHPDLVGVYFPMEQWETEVFDIVKYTGNQPVKIFSYELKKELDFSNLRESYFQAVSNSSWANEGYLVSAVIDQSEDFISEIKRLSNSFGIGLIQLNVNNPDDSEIIIPARQKDILDIEMINKIVQINPDFKEFISRIKIDLNSKEIRKEKFDKIFNDVEELKKLYK
ncbi:hypothetical protein AGMMS50212_09440 [Spirochaetia bacterium]|nr:hypothetical protein AGMMS50212_09440 [Spirochaetia bacterium]